MALTNEQVHLIRHFARKSFLSGERKDFFILSKLARDYNIDISHASTYEKQLLDEYQKLVRKQKKELNRKFNELVLPLLDKGAKCF